MNWRDVSLGEIAPLSYGKGLPELKRAGGEVPVFGSNGIVGWHNSAIVYNPSIIVGRKGTVGALNFSSTSCWPIDTAFYTEGSEECDIKFLHYLMKTLPLKESSDSAVPGLNRDYAHSLRVKIPDLNVQKSIAIVLDSLDEKIRINQQIAKTLEEIAQTIFKSWFVDFDPVHAKSRGEQPVGMDAETAALFPDSFEDSELGPIPSGWRVCEVGDELKFVGGSTPSTSVAEYWDGEYSWTTPKDLSVQQGLITIDSARKISTSGLAKITSGLLPVGSVLMSSRAPIGYLSITNIRTAINQGFIGFPASEIHHPIYILNWLLSNLGEIKNRAGGSSFAEISKTAFQTMQFLVPSRKISLKFGELVEPFLEEITNLTYEIRTLSQLRDALLPRLISGELEIPEELLVS